MDRLYIIVREDLPPCHQACQAGHAVAAFAYKHPIKFLMWFTGASNLVYLSVKTIRDLWDLQAKLPNHVPVHEPDMGWALTAIAVDGAAKPQLRHLRLALR